MRLKILIVFVFAAVIISCDQKEKQMKYEYPEPRKVYQADDYFGTKVEDPYRWLENDTSKETAEWVKAQNKVTFDYFAKIPFRDKIRERLKQLWDFPKTTAPFKKYGHYFFYKNDGLQNQSLLCVKEKIDEEEKVLLDPNRLSENGTVALTKIGISKDGKYLAYGIARGGSDWNEVFVKEIESSKELDDHLQWVKFSNSAWFKDGFFYSGYSAPKKGTELSKKNEYHKLFYHKLGTKQSADNIIMEDKKNPLRMFYAQVTDDEKYLLIFEENAGNRGQAVYYKDLSKPNSKIINLIGGFENEFSFIDNTNNNLLFRTNFKAPKYRLVSIDVNNPGKENCKEIIPEKENVLESCQAAAGKIVISYMKDAYTQIELYSYDGKPAGKIDLPGIGTVTAFNGGKNDSIAFYTFASFVTPGDHYKYDFSKSRSEIYQSSKIKFDGTKYETKQVFFKSKDGTKIPMFITYKKGLVLDGNNPTIIYGYGGFNVSQTPDFKIPYVLWLENGGIYAVVNLRGGGEYGKAWHEAGTKLKKQNVFNDFIAAAEYLIKEKYTCPDKLAARGGSNGGLLVGAVVNQRPDLFKAAIATVGVMDMLRYQKFTIGWNWVSDYGSSDNKDEFRYIYKYSPLHNIRENINYPAVLITTADHDDRVVPAHSFKYISTLQEKYKGPNPVMIRIETMAGHGAGKPTAKLIEEYTDVFSFIFFNLGVTPEYK
ncbi:MAG: S9 family peptidase [Bacteroidia bacterium]|nr:S9 family peptidase [Bacteroidia bacterium]